MQIVHDGDEAHAAFRQSIVACVAIDERVCFITWAFKNQFALRIFDAKISQGCVDTVLVSQVLNDLQLGYFLGICRAHPRLVDIAFELDRLLLAGEPIRVVESDSSKRKKQQDGKARHRYVDMQPSRPFRQKALPFRLNAWGKPTGDPLFPRGLMDGSPRGPWLFYNRGKQLPPPNFH